MKLHILHAAEEEFLEAIEYYEDITPGLGLRLKEEVRRTLRWIKANPEMPRERSPRHRRVNCTTFPYYIAYHIRAGEIFVVAIAHAKRRPGYWARRLKER